MAESAISSRPVEEPSGIPGECPRGHVGMRFSGIGSNPPDDRGGEKISVAVVEVVVSSVVGSAEVKSRTRPNEDDGWIEDVSGDEDTQRSRGRSGGVMT